MGRVPKATGCSGPAAVQPHQLLQGHGWTAHVPPYPEREAFAAIERAWREQHVANPLDPGIARGYAAFLAHDAERALGLLWPIVTENPERADVWLDMGRITGSRDDRLRFFHTARRTGSTQPNLLQWLATTALDLEDLETATAYGNELLARAQGARQEHGDAMDWRERGTALWERALAANDSASSARKVVSAHAQHADDRHWAHTTLGEVALSSGQTQEALDHLRASGEVAGSPRLSSYGPSLRLAAALAFEGLHDEVAAYLTATRLFWDDERVADWLEALHDGFEPGGWLEHIPDPNPTPEQQAAIDLLSTVDRDAIDARLLSHTHPRWLKVARIVAMSMMDDRRPAVPDVFYASRVRELIRQGKLELQGDPRRMRFSEVRLPSQR